MATEPLTGAQIPTDADAPLGGTAITRAVSDLADKTLPPFATSGARDTAFQNWVNAGHSMRAGLHSVVAGRLNRHNGSAWETVPGFRGQGTAYPSDAVTGDTYYHITLRSTMLYRGGTWWQIHVATVADAADLASYLSALNSAGLILYEGFQVWQNDTNQLYLGQNKSGNPLIPGFPQDFANASVNSGNSAITSAWQPTSFQWASALGAKITIPGDGVARTVKMFATCNISGDGYLRLRADTGISTSYWPNANGKRSVASANQEQDMTFIGRLNHDGSNNTVIYLEAKSTTAGSATFIIPVLDVTAF